MSGTELSAKKGGKKHTSVVLAFMKLTGGGKTSVKQITHE